MGFIDPQKRQHLVCPVELERRRFGGVDRTWSIQEFHRFLATCMSDGHEDFAAIARLQQYICGPKSRMKVVLPVP